jgi:hypothetical protein
VIAGVRERAFAFSRLGVDLALTEFERSLLDVVLGFELTQPLAGGVVGPVGAKLQFEAI